MLKDSQNPQMAFDIIESSYTAGTGKEFTERNFSLSEYIDTTDKNS